ncbi:hypothetical protein SDRG_14654 [Saprolegnia diclina VS20]|uniref:HSF-type DNA-binding domain-containing protein n=1 Tax=Saprolegnia diclina (strain VS20) TaxID=1156394 RepID=T0RDE2_SAPDV|nr:hypothetical protein SDRG_14654 [Saprolegnia diclina VS20]EQC27602.1 hypothetical protein SDRG_14654 [Saprolegnia diclina VS20]|eukprot:XP_008619022.1 hypothetical protein SDRG_14654 [Saprolegnia diclina VS20]
MTPRPTLAPFIQTLIEMLQSHAPCLHWNEDGKSFDILDIDVFSTSVLPRFFRHSKFTSFQRQLNYFSFRKQSRRQSSVCTYAHESLSLREPAQALQIVRKTVKERSYKAKQPDEAKAKGVLAYTEASMAYSQAWLKPPPPKLTDMAMDMTPLAFAYNSEADVGTIEARMPLLDDEMTSWLLTQFEDQI